MTFPFPNIDFYRDSNNNASTCSMDNRYYPIVLLRADAVWSEGTVDYYFFKWRNPIAEYAASRQQSIISILDLTTSGTPPATLRKRAGDAAANDKNQPGLLRTIVVTPNPLLRGVMTAVVWMAGSENVPISFVSTQQEAFRLGIAELEQHNVSAPDLNPNTYKFPTDELTKLSR